VDLLWLREHAPGQNDSPAPRAIQFFQNLISAKLAWMHWLQTLDTVSSILSMDH